MPKRIDIPETVIRRWLDLRLKRPDLSLTALGNIIRQEHPQFFAPECRGKNVCEALRRNADRLGIDVPRRPSGPTPRPNTRFVDECPELEFPHQSRLILISDLHASAHLPEYVERVAQVIESLEIPFGVFMGDQLNNDHTPHRGRTSWWAASAGENIDAFCQIARQWESAGLKHKKIIQGNHDDKVMRELPEGVLPYSQWWERFIAPELDNAESWDVTHRYYCRMLPEFEEPWPWPHGHRNFPWLFMHQAEYSIIPLRTATEHATKWMCNVVCGHQHHLGFTRHRSGITWVADAGTGQAPELATYKVVRPTKHPEWMPGFLTIINNQLMDWPIDMSDEEFRRRIGR